MSDPARLIFDLEDIDSNDYGYLNEVLRTKAAQFYVEFLQQGGPKPHVILHINSHQATVVRRHEREDLHIKGCLIGIDYVGSGLRGEFTVKLVPYQDSSHAAKAAFQFPLFDTETRILDLINILRGRYPSLPTGHDTDLTRFDFIEATSSGDLDGCRDAIAQWMIRLHATTKVKWNASGQGVGNITFRNLAARVATDSFHDIIGNNYTTGSERDGRGRVLCNITPLPLNRGTFRSSQVHRIEDYHGAHLPYVRLAAASVQSPTIDHSRNRHVQSTSRHAQPLEPSGQTRVSDGAGSQTVQAQPEALQRVYDGLLQAETETQFVQMARSLETRFQQHPTEFRRQFLEVVKRARDQRSKNA